MNDFFNANQYNNQTTEKHDLLRTCDANMSFSTKKLRVHEVFLRKRTSDTFAAGSKQFVTSSCNGM